MLCFTAHQLQIEGIAKIHTRTYVLLPLVLLGGDIIETFEIIWNTFLYYLCLFYASVVVLDNLGDIDGKLVATAIIIYYFKYTSMLHLLLVIKID